MLERRAKHRAKVALPGCAVFAKLGDAPCVVLNLSVHGACIAFAPGTEIPRSFELRIGPDSKRQGVRVVWRRSNTVGVAFLEARNAPDVMPV
ncbi:MAG: PilZ domain-containing protein [Rhodospirillales bacterium]|nr:PilZ domain-containing protein [Acetobacter sp.]